MPRGGPVQDPILTEIRTQEVVEAQVMNLHITQLDVLHCLSILARLSGESERVCVWIECERERERERERESRARKREREYVCVCVCERERD